MKRKIVKAAAMIGCVLSNVALFYFFSARVAALALIQTSLFAVVMMVEQLDFIDAELEVIREMEEERNRG